MLSLLDIQVNGFAGVDFQSSDLKCDDLRVAVDGLAQHETRRFFATVITDAIASLEGKLRNFESCRDRDPAIADAICGYHVEGPWLSPEPGFCGAHPPKHMGPPDLDAFMRLQAAANGRIRLLTVAPEWENSEDFIRKVVAAGVEVSLGHTDASEDDIDRAIGAGARFCTHLGNGVPAMMHRHDNVIQRMLARDELYTFFIPDGIHVPSHVLRNFVRAKPAGKALFTTDCMAAAGAPSGTYPLGDLELEVGEDRVVRMPGSPNFAGSALSPNEGVNHVAEWLGWPVSEARAAFSTRIADLFGIELPEIPG